MKKFDGGIKLFWLTKNLTPIILLLFGLVFRP